MEWVRNTASWINSICNKNSYNSISMTAFTIWRELSWTIVLACVALFIYTTHKPLRNCCQKNIPYTATASTTAPSNEQQWEKKTHNWINSQSWQCIQRNRDTRTREEKRQFDQMYSLKIQWIKETLSKPLVENNEMKNRTNRFKCTNLFFWRRQDYHISHFRLKFENSLTNTGHIQNDLRKNSHTLRCVLHKCIWFCIYIFLLRLIVVANCACVCVCARICVCTIVACTFLCIKISIFLLFSFICLIYFILLG